MAGVLDDFTHRPNVHGEIPLPPVLKVKVLLRRLLMRSRSATVSAVVSVLMLYAFLSHQ